MDQPIVQGLLTFLGGAVVAGLNALLSARLLGDVCDSFRVHCVEGITPNVERMTANLHNSLMLVGAALGLTALSMVFAMLLARRNDKKSKSAAADKKGEDLNG